MNVRIKGIYDIILPYWARSLMVKHFSDKEESDSSILSAPTSGRLAQWLEHFAYIEGVGGSNPSATTMSETSEIPTSNETDSSKKIDWYSDSDYKHTIGTYLEVVDNEDQIGELEKILNEPFNQNSSRNVAVAVIPEARLKTPSEKLKKFAEQYLETAIPLTNTGILELEDCYMVWFGKNQDGRFSDQRIIDEEVRRVKEIFTENRLQTVNHTSDSLPGFETTVLTKDASDEVKNQVKELLKKLEWEEEGTDEVLDTSEDLLAVAIKDENGQKTVLGVGMAIFDGVELTKNGKKIPLNIYEFTGAVTREGFERKGIYQAVSRKILEELAARTPQVHMGIGYSNASEVGVMRAGFKMGRSLSILETEKLGYKGKPLMQHSTVSGKFVDDIITFIPGNIIRQNFGKAV